MVKISKEKNVRFTVNGETFTLEEMRTVIDSDYRWEFGDYATVSVMKEGGLAKGNHHIKAVTVLLTLLTCHFSIEAVL